MTRNDVIDEVIAELKSIEDHNQPMPEVLRPGFDEALKRHGIETMCRLSGDAMKELAIERVAALKN